MCAFSMHMCRSESSELQLKEKKRQRYLNLMWVFFMLFQMILLEGIVRPRFISLLGFSLLTQYEKACNSILFKNCI